MKRDPDKKLTISARRTLHDLQDVLVDLLENEPLEKITVRELCERAMIPRATFYNYFEDKYDLLQYHWACVQTELDPFLREDIQPALTDSNYAEYIKRVAMNLIDYISAHIKEFRNIERANERSSFFQGLQEYIKTQIKAKLTRLDESEALGGIPDDLAASFVSSVAITLGRWWLENEGNYTRDQAMDYFTTLLVDSSLTDASKEGAEATI